MPEPGSTRRVSALALVPALAVLSAEVERSGDVAARRLSLAVIGLVALGALIAVATVVFWRLTRPDPVASPGTAEGGVDWLAAFSASSGSASTDAATPAPGQLSVDSTGPAAAPTVPSPALTRRDPGATRHGSGGAVASDGLGNV